MRHMAGGAVSCTLLRYSCKVFTKLFQKPFTFAYFFAMIEVLECVFIWQIYEIIFIRSGGDSLW